MIFLHVGKVGTGKTFSCTAEILKHLYNGIDCYADWSINPQPFFSTKIFKFKHKIRVFICRIFKKPFPKYGKLYRFKFLQDIYGISHGEIYIDEAHKWLNAREFDSTPPEFISKMSQSRKYHTNLHFITQHPLMVDVAIRRICNQLIVHKKFFRLLLFKIYDGMYVNTFDRPEKPPPCEHFGFKFLTKITSKCYDTFEILGTFFDDWKSSPVWEFMPTVKSILTKTIITNSIVVKVKKTSDYNL